MLINQVISGKNAIITAMLACNTQGKAWQEAVQVVAASTCLHIHEHGDYRIVESLLKDFPKGGKTSALVAFFNANAPIEIETKGADFSIVFDSDSRCDFAAMEKGTPEEQEQHKSYLVDLLNTGWWTFKPAPKKSKLDVPKKVADLIKAIQEHQTAPVDGDVIPKDAINLLKLHNGSSIDYELLLSLVTTELLEEALEKRLKEEEEGAALEDEIERLEDNIEQAEAA